MVVAVTESMGSNRTPQGKPPGWEPDHVNPNVQRYWDGAAWTATRRWVSGQWVDETVPTSVLTTPVPAAPRQNRYATQPHGQPPSFDAPRVQRPRARVTPAIAGLFICGVLLIVGSVTPWLTLKFGPVSTSASGTQFHLSQSFVVNGWFTLAAGIVLIILATMIIVSDEGLFRSLAFVVSMVAALCAVYALVRILQAISESSSSTLGGALANAVKQDAKVGWGLIVVLVGAIGAVICAFGTTRRAQK